MVTDFYELFVHRPRAVGACSASTTSRSSTADLEQLASALCTCTCSVAKSCLTLGDPVDCSPLGSSVHGDSPGKNTGGSSCSLLQWIFPTHGSNPGLPHCRWILYCLSHQESPRILEWVACPFSRGSSQPRNQTEVSCIAGRFFTS